MPLLRFDLIEGRSESELKRILDVTHEVLLETLQVPKHDRYQVVHEHSVLAWSSRTQGSDLPDPTK
jgi:hypothetical protein